MTGWPDQEEIAVEVFVHRAGKERSSRRELIEADGSQTLNAALGLGDGEEAWLQDGDAPLDPNRVVAETIEERSHIHIGRCRQVEVAVNFNSDGKERDFRPGAPVERIFDRATSKDGFPMSDVDKAEHTLQLCGTTDQPDSSDHVGSLVSDGSCEVCFDLVAKHRFEG
jgi:hypothetical protein